MDKHSVQPLSNRRHRSYKVANIDLLFRFHFRSLLFRPVVTLCAGEHSALPTLRLFPVIRLVSAC